MSHEMDEQGKIGTAAEWFVDVDTEALDAPTESEFEEWLESDAENERALERCEAAARVAAFLENDPELRWAYDEIDALVTPEPERQPSRRARPRLMRPRFAWICSGLATICVVAVLVAYDRSRLLDEDTNPVSGGLMGDSLAPGSLPDPTVVIPVDRSANSIAVLPFENLSPNPANESVTAAIHEEILTQLEQIGSLNTISGTSVPSDANSNRSISEIADELGVQTIVEGSVLYEDGRVRVAVQLIDAETDSHLWAETYDRELSGVLEIQSDIASSVAQTLGVAVAAGSTLDDTTAAAAALVPERNLVWVGRDGREAYVMVPARSYTGVRLSPDGQRVAATIFDYDDATQQGREDIWVLDLLRQTMTRLTFDDGPNVAPVWAPDGQSIVYGVGGYTGGIVRRSADGAGELMWLTAASPGRGHFPSAISPDGSALFFDIRGSQSAIAHRLRLNGPLYGDDVIHPLVFSPSSHASQVAISPDGRWFAYTSNETGRAEVYVRPFPNVQNGRWQVSAGGGREPIWARDGRALYYRYGNAIFDVDVDTQTASFTSAAPQMAFTGAYVSSDYAPSYDVSPDGQRFLLMKDLP